MANLLRTFFIVMHARIRHYIAIHHMAMHTQLINLNNTYVRSSHAGLCWYIVGRFAKRLSMSTGSTSTTPTKSTKRTSKGEVSEEVTSSNTNHGKFSILLQVH